MTAIDLETQRQTILHYWNHGVHSAKEIHILTKIPIQTIYYNLRKLEKTGNTMHKKGAGRPLIITAYASRTIGQYVRRNPTISLRTLVTKISRNGVDVSRETVRRHMHNSGYQKNVPKATPMLTETHKAKLNGLSGPKNILMMTGQGPCLQMKQHFSSSETLLNIGIRVQGLLAQYQKTELKFLLGEDFV